MRGSLIRRGLGVAGIATLALGLTVSGALAGNHGKHFGKVAAKVCAKERKALGGKTFMEVYGKPAMPHCIGVTKPEVKQDRRQANRDCRAERSKLGVDAFRNKYGTNHNKRNAWGKCVSGKTKAELRQDRQDVINAAKACKAERSDPDFADTHDGKSFREYYGKNKNGKNAYGKCVSGKAKAADEQTTTT